MNPEKITVAEMCAAASHAFSTSTLQSMPSQTLDQWAASQGIVHVVQPVIAEPLTPQQIKRRRLNAHMRIST